MWRKLSAELTHPLVWRKGYKNCECNHRVIFYLAECICDWKLRILILDDFLPQQPGLCSNEENVYGEYTLLKLAQLACAKDSQCIGVQDEDCDGAGIFRLCKNGFRNPSLSCIYRKKDYNGTNPFVSCSKIRRLHKMGIFTNSLKTNLQTREGWHALM